jgi:hypothetical protein
LDFAQKSNFATEPFESAVTEMYQDAFVGSSIENGVTIITFDLRQGTHLRRDTVIPQWLQASKAAAASDGHAVHC